MELLTENAGPEKDNSYGVEANERFVLPALFVRRMDICCCLRKNIHGKTIKNGYNVS